MLRSVARLVLRGGAALVLSAALLSLVSTPVPTNAQEDPTFYSEMRLIGPLTTYTEANASSAIKAKLPSGSVVDMFTTGRVVGPDGQLWARVRQPNGEDLGWAKVTEINLAAGNEPYYGISTLGYGTPYYDPNTGTIINPSTGIATPVSPLIR